MIKVITYGTFDLLHYGHVRLLERAKALGDYLIVAVTAEDFDKTRGKINVKQSLMERIEAVRSTGLADEIIVEEYVGQKIDDIKKYDIDIFTVGSDWKGKFDYLGEYCRVVYLERTQGISSSEIRGKQRSFKLGLVGESSIIDKVIRESRFVNGIEAKGIYSEGRGSCVFAEAQGLAQYGTYDELLNHVDAVYIISVPQKHKSHIESAIKSGKHVLCESPIAVDEDDCRQLFLLAKERGCILMDSIKTAYATAYHRMLLMVKSGAIGKVISVDATCTSIRNMDFVDEKQMKFAWNSINAWGPTGMLPVFQILGTDYVKKTIITKLRNRKFHYDEFTKIDFIYADAVASVKVGQGAKSEGSLVISGTGGYIYVPAPWWKTEYYEIRYEAAENNRRYFYQLDGEGIRQELVSFARAIETGRNNSLINESTSMAIAGITEDFYNSKDIALI